VAAHIAHAEAFSAVVATLGPDDRPALDLGTGGGLPGLVLALAAADRPWTLLDGRERSVEFVRWAIGELGLANRVAALLGRAEDVGRDGDHRGRYGLVVARSFGPPAVTSECAAALLDRSGHLVVSEPPGSTGGRWPAEGLRTLGLRWNRLVALPAATFAVLDQVESAPVQYPRRVGIPRKRPLF
jgi:16S rRNA (guanine527-N7)-methyltransferase